MLTRQPPPAETISLAVDNFSLGFVISDDGRTLLAVTGTEEGGLELLTTPVSLIHPNGTVLSPQMKINNGGSAGTSSLFQINLENIVGGTSSQPAILVENSDNVGVAIGENEKTRVEPIGKKLVRVVPSRASDLVDKVTLVPEIQKKGPGRPRKDPNAPSSRPLKCEICGEEFKKQMLYRKHMEHHAEEKPHRCPKCPASFNIPSNFTLHMATHNIGDPKCPECGRKFARMASLKSHMMVHEKEENLFCTECEDAFSTKAQLDAHLKLHNEKWSSEDVRKCKLCNKQFTQPALYRLHIREHYRLQTKIMKQTKRGLAQKTVYKCKICTKVFQKPSQLMRHIRVHTGEKPFKCNVCGRGFSQKSSLQIHTWQHVGVRPYSCDKCNAKFSQKGNLNAHILRVHNAPEGEPIYACNQCSCVFKKLGSLNGHIKKMHAIPADEPPHCDSSTESSIKPNNSDSKESEKNDILQQALKNSGLSNKEKENSKNADAQTSLVTLVDKTPDGSLRKYVTIKQRRIGAIRWYACSFCHKEFKKPSDLIRHLRVHTQEKPFKCSYCHRSFALKSTMKAHERTHFGTKKYSCGICGKMFACHSSMTAHTRTHTKPHKCSVCDMSFSTNTVLKSHMKSHSKPKSKLSPEAERLVPQIVLEEPLVISDAGNKISVAQVQSKQRHVYNTEDEGNRPHKCWACPAAFRKISHLKQHYRRHTGERPYKCPKCDRRFTSNSVLKAHLHTHEEARPFSCNVCNATFSTQSSQKRHLVTHSNKRPFMCPYCHKTFKTSVNCRKHMKIHKNELAQQQLEKQRGGGEAKMMVQEKEIRSSVLGENLNLEEEMGVHFQGNIGADFGFPESLQIIGGEKGKGMMGEASGAGVISQNLPSVEPDNLNTSTQTLHADETGTITLPNYTGEQTLTAESIREIEETLNQQLYTIGLGNLDLTNNLTRQISDSGSGSLETREQPVLNIIYDNQKVLDSTVQTASIFGSPHFDTFDMSQITLQADTEIDMGISSANSTSMASILPRSAQEEQRLIPVSNCGTINPPSHQTNHQSTHLQNQSLSTQAKSERQLVVVSSDLPRQPISCPKFPKIIAKADTTDASGLLNLDGDQSLDKSLSLAQEKITLSSFQDTSDLESQMHNIYEVSEMINKESQLQCHICLQKGFSARTLKEHLKSHRGSKEFQCPECSMKFCTNGGLTRHLRVHNNKQTESYNCPTCFESFPTEHLLKRHSKTHDLMSWNVTNPTIEPDSSQKDPVSVDPELLTINERQSETDSSVSEKVLLDSVAERDMIKHLTNNEAKEKKEYTNKCKYCPKTFRKPSDLIRHIRTHTGERPYQCKHCEKSFAVKCTLDCHMKVHDGTKSFCCHVCNSLFATKGSLKVHMRLHTGSKPFKCPICEQRFRTSGHRKVHVLTHMKDGKENGNRRKGKQKKPENPEISEIPEKNNAENNVNQVEQMPEAGQISEQPSDYPNVDTITIDATGIGDQLSFNPDGAILNNNSVLSVNESNQLVASLHFLLSNGLVTIQTDENSLLLNGNMNQADGNLMSENLAEAENNLVIATQLEGLPEQQGLNNLTLVQMPEVQQQPAAPIPTTMNVSHQAKPGGRSKNPTKKECDICGKTFMKPCQVERHKRIHTGERPFKCELCDKSFAQKVTLQMHQKHHTGDRPYSCPHCDYSFTQKGNLQTHLRRVHQLDTIEGKKLRRGQQLSAKAPETDHSNSQINVNRLLNLDDISLVEYLK